MAFHWYAGGMDRLQDGTFGYHFLAKAHQMLAESAAAQHGAGPTDPAEGGSEGGEDDDDDDGGTVDDASANGVGAAAPNGPDRQNPRATKTPFLLGSEGCNCPGTEAAGTSLSWLRSERYAHDILQDLNHFASGWVDWNLLLSAEGGPNHLGNLCDAPLLATPNYDGVTVQPYLYAIGHFSKFFVPGTQVVRAKTNADFTTTTASADTKKVSFGGPSKVVSGAAVTTWPCDGSSRQRFSLARAAQSASGADSGAWRGPLQLAGAETWADAGVDQNLAASNSDAAAFPATPSAAAALTLCVANANNAATGQPAQVIDCSAGEWVAHFSLPPGGAGQLRLQNPPLGSYPEGAPAPVLCLSAVPAYAGLMAHGGGGPVALAPCAVAPGASDAAPDDGAARADDDDDDGALPDADASAWAHQQWGYAKASLQVTSLAPARSGGGQCLTAGWPFVQAVAGVTPQGATVAVVVNEAAVPVRVTLALEDGANIAAELPPQSIQTFVVENPSDPQPFI